METKQKMVRNAIQCLKCNDIIESKSVHDFKSCKCGQVFVDGGLDYQRIGFHEKNDYINLCEYQKVPLPIWK